MSPFHHDKNVYICIYSFKKTEEDEPNNKNTNSSNSSSSNNNNNNNNNSNSSSISSRISSWSSVASSQLIYTGVENSATLTKLNSSGERLFRIELCNSAGCSSTAAFNVSAAERAHPSWSASVRPRHRVLNSSHIEFDWSDYPNASVATTFRLERAEIAFAYPPQPLEAGIRFDGFTYLQFDADTHYPQGYTFFGLKQSLRSAVAASNSLNYYASST